MELVKYSGFKKYLIML